MAPGLADPLWHGGEQARGQARNAMAGDELGEIAPVRADVGEGARRSAGLLVDAPVVVVLVEEPVLQVGAVHQAQRTGGAGAHPLPGLPDSRVVAVDERHRVRPARLERRRREAPGSVRVERERLLADHVLAGLERALGELDVEVVGSADVDDVDIVGLDELLRGVEGALGAERCRGGGAPLGRGRRDADQPRAHPLGGPGMDSADKTCTGNGNP